MAAQINLSDLRELTLPWTVQVVLFIILAVGYPALAAAVFYRASGSAGGIIAGSLFGAYPVLLAGGISALKKPHIEVLEETTETAPDGGIICTYPHRWFAYRQSQADGGASPNESQPETHASINAARTIVALHNDGWGKATRCRAWIRLREANPDDEATAEEHTFPVRWERADNPLEMDLTPGEKEEVVLSEVDLFDRAFKTALSNRLSDEIRATPHEYARAERYEIQRGGRYHVSVVVTSDDMALVERPLDLGGGRGNPVTVPDFADDASEWGVLQKLREDPDRLSAVWYRTDGRDVIRVEDDFDFDRLADVDPEDQPELAGPFLPDGETDRSYREVLQDHEFVIELIGDS